MIIITNYHKCVYIYYTWYYDKLVLLFININLLQTTCLGSWWHLAVVMKRFWSSYQKLEKSLSQSPDDFVRYHRENIPRGIQVLDASNFSGWSIIWYIALLNNILLPHFHHLMGREGVVNSINRYTRHFELLISFIIRVWR